MVPKPVTTWRDPAFWAIVIAAAALRVPGCFSDPWLDEIATLIMTGQLQSAMGIVTEMHTDNNHPLNSLICYLLGSGRPDALYRLHSLAAGTGAVVLAWFIGCGAGRLEARFAALLMAVSYPMIHFSNEARGYALVIFFALATFLAMQRFLSKPLGAGAAAFWLCTVLGVLSHLMYLSVFIAAHAWFAVDAIGSRRKLLHIAARYALGFAVPWVILALFYFLLFKHLHVGRGPSYVLGDILVRAFSFAGGGPATGFVAISVAISVACLFLAATLRQRHMGNGAWAFTLTVIFLPPVVATVHRFDVLPVRYFLFCIAFGLVAAGAVLAAAVRRGGAPRVAVAIVMAGFLIGNGINVYGLYRYGHGSYREALQLMAALNEGPRIIVSSDQDFRNRLTLKYYERDLPADKQLVYVDRHEFPPEGTPWRILHRIGETGPIDQIVQDRYRNSYALVKHFPYSGRLSGWHWFLYHRSTSDGT